MKILYHHRTRSADGQRVHIDGLIGALRRAGHEVEIVAPKPRREAGPTTLNSGAASGDKAPARADGGPPRASLLRELAEQAYDFVERRALRRAIDRFHPAAIYSRHALFSTAAAVVARERGLPLSIEVNAPLALERSQHGGLFFEARARRLETATLNRADRVVVVTQAMGELLVEQGVERSRLEVHWNGLEPEALRGHFDGGAIRRALGLTTDSRDALVLGFVGFVRDWNRLERLFPFLARTRSARFVVVGEGPDQPRLLRLAAEAGVAARVHFVGTVPRAKVLDHVAAFDIALLPEVTRYASPLKLLDYFAAGKPALVPDYANLREVVADGENGLLFDPARAGDFERRLEELAASKELRERIGAAGRATIDRLGLTWDANARRVVEGFAAEVARRNASRDGGR